ncbi:11297_t:CDS:2, partial [Entrophospora sp. SA101]
WIVEENYNISKDFRNVQIETTERLKTDTSLSYTANPQFIKLGNEAWKNISPKYLTPITFSDIVHTMIIEYSNLSHMSSLLSIKSKIINENNIVFICDLDFI